MSDMNKRMDVSEMAKGDNRWKTFLHLIGKTGTGKSATGNSLLGEKVFKVSSRSTSTIEGIYLKEKCVGELSLVVVDGPGLIGVDATGFNQDYWDMYKKVCEDNPDCGHVFLIVCRYGDRFTAEDSSMVDALLKDLGGDVFWNHGIVVVTCGDIFKADFEDEEGTTFKSWCRGQGGGFGQLVAACGQRVLLVDNSARSADRITLLTKMIYVMPGMLSSLTCIKIAALKNKIRKPARGQGGDFGRVLLVDNSARSADREHLLEKIQIFKDKMAEGDNRWKTFLHLNGNTGTGKSATETELLGDIVSASATSVPGNEDGGRLTVEELRLPDAMNMQNAMEIRNTSIQPPNLPDKEANGPGERSIIYNIHTHKHIHLTIENAKYVTTGAGCININYNSGDQGRHDSTRNVLAEDD